MQDHKCGPGMRKQARIPIWKGRVDLMKVKSFRPQVLHKPSFRVNLEQCISTVNPFFFFLIHDFSTKKKKKGDISVNNYFLFRNWAITRANFITYTVADTEVNPNNKNQSESQWLNRTVCPKPTCLHFNCSVQNKTVYLMYMEKSLWFKLLVCAFVILPSFVCIQDFPPFKLTSLQVAHFSFKTIFYSAIWT